MSENGATGDSRDAGGRFSRMSWRVLFWMTLVGLGPLIIMAAQGYHCAREAVIERAEAQLASVAESRRRLIEQWLAERTAELQRLGLTLSEEIEAEGGAETMMSRLEETGRINPAWSDFTFSQSADVEQVPENARKPQKPLEKADNPVFGRVHFLTDGGVGVKAALALRSPEIEEPGFLTATLRLSSTLDSVLTDPSGLGAGGRTYLYFPGLELVWAPYGTPPPSPLDPQAMLDMIYDRGARILEYGSGNEARVVRASRPVEGLGASVLVEESRDEMFGWLARLRKRAVITGAVTFVLVLIIAARGSRRLSEPLRRLSEVARNITGGRRDARLGPLRDYEARQVGIAFNRMLDELEAGQRKLVNAASLAAVGELSSSVVHEMRNPLSSVKINLQALGRRVKDDPAYSELAGIALEQAVRLERLLTELLQFGKPLELHPENIDLRDLAAEVTAVLDPRIREKKITLEGLDDLRDVRVQADREQLRRVLTNLVENAVEVSPSGGRIEISARRTPGAARLTVRDDGPGVAPENREQIFRPFFTTRERGTGLGLANVKKIIEAHGGAVELESSPGRGAAFTVLLPSSEVRT